MSAKCESKESRVGEMGTTTGRLIPECVAGRSGTIYDLPDEVIGLILHQLEHVSHLKIARLVCKTWNEEVCRILENKMITCISDLKYSRPSKPSIHGFMQLKTKASHLNLSTLLQKVRLNIYEEDCEEHFCREKSESEDENFTPLEDHPDFFLNVEQLSISMSDDFRKYNLERKEFVRLCEAILRKCDKILTHLDLEYASWHLFTLLSVRPPAGRYSFPQLRCLMLPMEEHMKVELNPHLHELQQNYYYYHWLVQEIGKMLELCPKLCAVSFWDDHGMRPDSVDRKPPEKFRQIQYLKLNFASHVLLTESLAQHDCWSNLKSLEIRNGFWEEDMNMDPKRLGNQLRAVAPNLEYLMLFIDAEDTFPDEIIPYLPLFPRLNALILEECDIKIQTLSNLLQKTPTLKELVIKQELDLDDFPNVDMIKSCPSLQAVHCSPLYTSEDYDPDDCDPEVFIRLRKLFPNVKRWSVTPGTFSTYFMSDGNQGLGSNGVVVEELLTKLDTSSFPSACVKGLKRLIIANEFQQAECEKQMKFFMNHQFLPDLEEVIFKPESKYNNVWLKRD